MVPHRRQKESRYQLWEGPGFQRVGRTSLKLVSVVWMRAWWGLHLAACEKMWHLLFLISPIPFAEPASLCPMTLWGCIISASSRSWGRIYKKKWMCVFRREQTWWHFICQCSEDTQLLKFTFTFASTCTSSWMGHRPAEDLWGLTGCDHVPWVALESILWVIPWLLERILEVSRDNLWIISQLMATEGLHWLQQSHLHHAIYVSWGMAHWLNWDCSSLYQQKIHGIFVHFLP